MKTKPSLSLSRYVAFFAIIISLTVISLALPFVFLIPLLFVALSFDVRITAITALIFGVISYLLSFVGGGSLVPLAFIEQPLIPIVPRFLVGLAAYSVNALCTRLFKLKGKLGLYLPKILAAAVGTITNTTFVILFMYIFLPSSFSDGNVSLLAYTPIMIGMGCIELIVNVIAVPPLTIAVKKALKVTSYGVLLSGQAYIN